MAWLDHFIPKLTSRLLAEAAELTGSTACDVTARFTGLTTSMLIDRGLHVTPEFPTRAAGFFGRIDLVARWSSRGRLVLAVEIDRSNNERSIAKLEGIRRREGCLCLWIRWGRELPSSVGLIVPPNVPVIEVPVDYRVIPSRLPPQ